MALVSADEAFRCSRCGHLGQRDEPARVPGQSTIIMVTCDRHPEPRKWPVEIAPDGTIHQADTDAIRGANPWRMDPSLRGHSTANAQQRLREQIADMRAEEEGRNAR